MCETAISISFESTLRVAGRQNHQMKLHEFLGNVVLYTGQSPHDRPSRRRDQQSRTSADL